MFVAAATVAAFLAVLIWTAATWRERSRGAIGLRSADGEARAAGACAQELRRQLGSALERADRLERALVDAEAGRAAATAGIEEMERRLADERTTWSRAEETLGDAFRALAADALSQNSEGFLLLASERLASAARVSHADLEARSKAIEGLVTPVAESLARVDRRMAELELERGMAYVRLTEQVRSLAATQQKLQADTGNLARALRAPAVRGRWGEVQLKRVVELAGMLEHCDFLQQPSYEGEHGRLRPDLIVRLPGGRQVVVDAKTPLEAYLQAADAVDDDARRISLRAHAAQVRAHIQKLSAKSYWADLPGTPDFVVLFLPGEAFYSAALEAQPSLIEEGVASRVLVATPTTLIALLHAVAFGWREERLADNAQKIIEQGRVLVERVGKLAEHWSLLGKTLGRATEHYNDAVGSFESRVLPAARKLDELGAGGRRELPELPHVDVRPRPLTGAPIQEIIRDVAPGPAGGAPSLVLASEA